MSEINIKLEMLYDCFIDKKSDFVKEVNFLISNPEKVENTNKFTSLLAELRDPCFIEPLLFKISNSNLEDLWLTDYMYAAIELLSESSVNDEFATPKNLINKLQNWILGHTGEISWKSANLLKYYESEKVEKIFLKKLEDNDDFFLTYCECISGLLRYDKQKHWGLIKEISNDETRDENLREYIIDIIRIS